jgi:hypothetical protein
MVQILPNFTFTSSLSRVPKPLKIMFMERYGIWKCQGRYGKEQECEGRPREVFMKA